jgi:hypothetical protein
MFDRCYIATGCRFLNIFHVLLLASLITKSTYLKLVTVLLCCGFEDSTAGTRPMRDHRRFLIQNTIKPSSQLHTAAFAIILTTRMPQLQQVVILKTSES